jgi:hypothetical protein
MLVLNSSRYFSRSLQFWIGTVLISHAGGQDMLVQGSVWRHPTVLVHLARQIRDLITTAEERYNGTPKRGHHEQLL